jgi:hypothetical protein
MALESLCFAHACEQLDASLLETLGLDYRRVEEACYFNAALGRTSPGIVD